MKRAELFKRLPPALAERSLGEGIYFVTIVENAAGGEIAHPVLSALVSMGGTGQSHLPAPIRFSFDFDADTDVKRLTAIVSTLPAPAAAAA